MRIAIYRVLIPGEAVDNPRITVRPAVQKTTGDKRFRFDRDRPDQARAPEHRDFLEDPEVPGSEAVQARKEFEGCIQTG